NAISGLTDERNTLAANIRTALNNAAFSGQKLDENQVKDWIDQANDLLGRANALAGSSSSESTKDLRKIKHIVVIYQENHSYANLCGGGETTNGRDNADAAHTTQVSQAGVAFNCLLQDDVNLTTPPLGSTCNSTSAFPNAPFKIDDYFQPS